MQKKHKLQKNKVHETSNDNKHIQEEGINNSNDYQETEENKNEL